MGNGELLEWIGDIIKYHHEKLDGTGYPEGLKKDEIPLASRIISIADIFDALTSPRIYRKESRKFTDYEAIEILRKDAHRSILDKNVLAAFEKAYYRCDILLSKATSYSKLKNPYLLQSEGDSSESYSLAYSALDSALKVLEINKSNLDDNLRKLLQKKIQIRLATIANLQGESSKALKILEKTEYLQLDKSNNKFNLQKAIAFRELSDFQSSQQILKQIIENENEEKVLVLSYLCLTKISLNSHNLEKLKRYLKKTESLLLSLKDKLNYDMKKSPLGTKLRWWDDDNIAEIEGSLIIINTRLNRRLCKKEALESAKKGIDFFEAQGSIKHIYKAKLELAQILSNQGSQNDAIFWYKHAIEIFILLGDHLNLFLSKMLLATSYLRIIATSSKDKTFEYENKVSEILDELEENKWMEKIPNNLIKTCEIFRSLFYFYTDDIEKAKESAIRIKNIISHKKKRGFTKPGIISNFIIFCSTNASYDEFIELSKYSRDSFYVIHELEILSETIIRFPNKSKSIMKRFIEIYNSMGKKCWLEKQNRYKKIFNSINQKRI